MPTRAERLHTRFKLIQQTLQELHGREVAFGAASASWLMALQYVHRQSMLRVLKECEEEEGPIYMDDTLIDNLEKEMEQLLQSFHKELCEYLGVSQSASWTRAKAFREVIHDICHEGG